MKDFKNRDFVHLLITELLIIHTKLPESSVRNVHANKIRKFLPNVHSVGVIIENNIVFREIYPTQFKWHL